jgi:hypothetical protein
VQTELEAMSEDPAFDELRFQEVGVEYDLFDFYTGDQLSVTVLVERPPGKQEPADFFLAVERILPESLTGRNRHINNHDHSLPFSRENGSAVLPCYMNRDQADFRSTSIRTDRISSISTSQDCLESSRSSRCKSDP